MRVVDLFAGCGGMSAGFQAADYEIVLAAEKWSEARNVYDLNFDHRSTDLDLSDLLEAVPRVMNERPDVIVGGPPCQEFSTAGTRREAEKADLTRNFAEIVNACRPTWFVMENVPAAKSSNAYAFAYGLLKSAGYGLTECVLDASRHGVPQLRKRLFLIGRQEEEDNFLLNDLQEDEASESLTVRQYLGDELGVEHYYRHPRHWGRKAIYSIDEPAATLRSANRPIPPKYTSHPNDAAPIKGVKPLTSRQRARLQTFETSFLFEGSQSDIDLMVANAVPVQLARHIGETIARMEEMRGMSQSETEFREWLEHRYQTRTAGNHVCRFKRAQKFLSGRAFDDPRDAVHEMTKNPEFSRLSPSVKSHLKQAVKLHFEFLGLR